MKWKWKCLGHLKERKRGQESRGGGGWAEWEQINRGNERRGWEQEHDSRIQIQSRLTLFEYVSFSKSSYPIYCIPLCSTNSLSIFCWDSHLNIYCITISSVICSLCFLFMLYSHLDFFSLSQGLGCISNMLVTICLQC